MPRGTILRVLLLTVAAIALPWSAAAETRIALVIGNSAYPSAPLGSPRSDAEAVAKKLADLGFAVTKKSDLGRDALFSAIREFSDLLQRPGAAGLFYYSGHGMQVNNRNYMIPVDASIRDEADVELDGVPMENVLRRMELAQSNPNIVILDACRDNPFEKRFKSAEAGLARMQFPTSTLIAFAAAPGRVAEAASGGRLSPYTQALIEQIDTPGQDLIKMFQVVQNAVLERTQGRQRPHVEISPGLPDFSFRPVVAATGVVRPKEMSDKPTPRKEATPSDWTPKLVVPQNGSTVSQPFLQRWPFKWDEPSGPNSVKEYNIRVFGAKAAYPLIDINTSASKYVIPQSCSYIVDRNRGGWGWQVRPQFSDGSWGEWSQISSFDVSPFNQKLFCQHCPSRADICGGR